MRILRFSRRGNLVVHEHVSLEDIKMGPMLDKGEQQHSMHFLLASLTAHRSGREDLQSGVDGKRRGGEGVHREQRFLRAQRISV